MKLGTIRHSRYQDLRISSDKTQTTAHTIYKCVCVVCRPLEIKNSNLTSNLNIIPGIARKDNIFVLLAVAEFLRSASESTAEKIDEQQLRNQEISFAFLISQTNRTIRNIYTH